MDKYEEYNKSLIPCRCGGKVILTGGTYGYPTFGIKCLKCGGQWSMNTYSPEEAATKWGTSNLQPTTIVAGVHPKKQSKNRFIQWLLIKFFGYELEYKTVMAKTIVIKADDCPITLNGEFAFTIGEENDYANSKNF